VLLRLCRPGFCGLTEIAGAAGDSMPQPHKKRGRRMEGKKRKLDGGEDDPEIPEGSSKRRKSVVDASNNEDEFTSMDIQDESLDGAYPRPERPFFGVLDDEEQEYFKRTDDMLETNAFSDAEERDLFLSNVYREADGKELKMAQSQSCSRLMERLIQMSSAAQLKTLFRKFSGKSVQSIFLLPNVDYRILIANSASYISSLIDLHRTVVRHCSHMLRRS
jgi:hypothetical protein